MGTWVTDRLVNDMENVLLETNSGGTTQVAYTLEPAGYGSLVSQRRSGATSWHLFDALGSTDRLLDSSETEEASYINTAFGVPEAATGNHPNHLRFVGRLGYRWEPDATQYDVRRRRYAAARGEWISRDQRGLSVGLWVYSGNDPVNRVDYTGLWTFVVHQETTKWIAANEVAELRFFPGRSPQRVLVGFFEGSAQVIANADQYVDSIQFSAPGCSWHFNEPISPPFGTRLARRWEAYCKALEKDAGHQCHEALENLGYALHPLQDDTGHLDATPCEHMDVANDPKIDSARYDVDTSDPQRYPFVIDPSVEQEWGRAAADVIRAACGSKKVRHFRFIMAPVGSESWRYRRAEADTKGLLGDYLMAAKNCFDVKGIF